MNAAENTLDFDSRAAGGIVVLDDEPANVSLLVQLLREGGHEDVHGLNDPRQLMALLERHPIDLLLLDLNMPYLDGYQIIGQVQSLEHPPCVLVLTAHVDRDNRLRALKSGARDFVSKPFDAEELLARTRNLIEMRRSQVSLRQQNRTLETHVRERTQEIHDTRLEIIRRLGRAAEFRDNETGLHIIRMSKISQIVGRAAGMSEAEAEVLLNASPMHDIGKIGIPDRILLKPGKLDADEWCVMQSHARIGADLLDGHDAPLLAMARDIALTHHEKWDGGGYPDGLRAEQIPLVGRIVALADVFDALTSVRPYKAAWPVEQALDHIRAQRGIHFDPYLTDIFMDCLDEIRSICHQFAEPGEGTGKLYG
ncbi:MAG: response regulator [Betaproteobacteria bacterium]|nr:response regulator [Betaproteobacteria bacterium]